MAAMQPDCQWSEVVCIHEQRICAGTCNYADWSAFHGGTFHGGDTEGVDDAHVYKTNTLTYSTSREDNESLNSQSEASTSSVHSSDDSSIDGTRPTSQSGIRTPDDNRCIDPKLLELGPEHSLRVNNSQSQIYKGAIPALLESKGPLTCSTNPPRNETRPEPTIPFLSLQTLLNARSLRMPPNARQLLELYLAWSPIKVPNFRKVRSLADLVDMSPKVARRWLKKFHKYGSSRPEMVYCLRSNNGLPVKPPPRDQNKVYACPSGCGFQARQKDDWKKHMALNFLKSYWQCSECPKKFNCRRKDKLKSHIQISHPSLPPSDDPERDYYCPDEDDKSFQKQCGFCGTIFKSFDDFANHVGDHLVDPNASPPWEISMWKDLWDDASEDVDEDYDSYNDNDDDDDDDDYDDDDDGNGRGNGDEGLDGNMDTKNPDSGQDGSWDSGPGSGTGPDFQGEDPDFNFNDLPNMSDKYMEMKCDYTPQQRLIATTVPLTFETREDDAIHLLMSLNVASNDSQAHDCPTGRVTDTTTKREDRNDTRLARMPPQLPYSDYEEALVQKLPDTEEHLCDGANPKNLKDDCLNISLGEHAGDYTLSTSDNIDAADKPLSEIPSFRALQQLYANEDRNEKRQRANAKIQHFLMGSDGWSPLHAMTYSGNPKLLRNLLKKQEPNDEDNPDDEANPPVPTTRPLSKRLRKNFSLTEATGHDKTSDMRPFACPFSFHSPQYYPIKASRQCRRESAMRIDYFIPGGDIIEDSLHKLLDKLFGPEATLRVEVQGNSHNHQTSIPRLKQHLHRIHQEQPVNDKTSNEGFIISKILKRNNLSSESPSSTARVYRPIKALLDTGSDQSIISAEFMGIFLDGFGIRNLTIEELRKLQDTTGDPGRRVKGIIYMRGVLLQFLPCGLSLPKRASVSHRFPEETFLKYHRQDDSQERIHNMCYGLSDAAVEFQRALALADWKNPTINLPHMDVKEYLSQAVLNKRIQDNVKGQRCGDSNGVTRLSDEDHFRDHAEELETESLTKIDTTTPRLSSIDDASLTVNRMIGTRIFTTQSTILLNFCFWCMISSILMSFTLMWLSPGREESSYVGGSIELYPRNPTNLVPNVSCGILGFWITGVISVLLAMAIFFGCTEICIDSRRLDNFVNSLSSQVSRSKEKRYRNLGTNLNWPLGCLKIGCLLYVAIYVSATLWLRYDPSITQELTTEPRSHSGVWSVISPWLSLIWAMELVLDSIATIISQVGPIGQTITNWARRHLKNLLPRPSTLRVVVISATTFWVAVELLDERSATFGQFVVIAAHLQLAWELDAGSRTGRWFTGLLLFPLAGKTMLTLCSWMFSVVSEMEIGLKVYLFVWALSLAALGFVTFLPCFVSDHQIDMNDNDSPFLVPTNSHSPSQCEGKEENDAAFSRRSVWWST